MEILKIETEELSEDYRYTQLEKLQAQGHLLKGSSQKEQEIKELQEDDDEFFQ